MEIKLKKPFTAVLPAEKKAAAIFDGELEKRLGAGYGDGNGLSVVFKEDASFSSADGYSVALDGEKLTFSASGIRGLIFAAGLFLRKTEYKDGKITLIGDISGEYHPEKEIRGHQLGYRPCANTYDKWRPADYERYYLDLMFFGANTVEHIPIRNGVSEKNPLMELDERELLIKASESAHELGLEVSLWYPNSEKDLESAVKNREAVFAETPFIDALFIPGSDPGDLSADELFDRSEKFAEVLRKYHPDAKVYISAQAPRSIPGWGDAFIRRLNEEPEFLDGVITGPNHAFDIESLRRLAPEKYPIRFYPDITHCLRCEYPVHFLKDDWHYAFCAAFGRESVCPRPEEYALLHKLTSHYTTGSVSYSEGVNDDVNKAVWSALEWDAQTPVREILEDWARLYLPGCDVKTAADALEGLEKNWESDPANSPSIDNALALWESLSSPSLLKNWRYVHCLFRARCDKYIKDKYIFENSLLCGAKALIKKGRTGEARRMLSSPLPDGLTALRKQIDLDADALFGLIGIQLSVERHGASGWERGATLDTLDLPITDREYLLSLDDEGLIREAGGEKADFYFSFALNPLDQLGTAQQPEHYMDILADKKEYNDGTLPVRMFKLFDHYSLKLRRGGFAPGEDYVLSVTYKNTPDEKTLSHRITANGKLIYEGPQFGGEENRLLTDSLPKGKFTARDYILPAKVFENGCLELEISEPTVGFEAGELRITKKREMKDI